MSPEPEIGSIAEHFSKVKDPHIDRTTRHKLLDILLIAICGVICGADSWVDIELFGKTKLEWLKGFLKLQNDIPSHDTFGRVFAAPNPEEFESSFMEWVQAINQLTHGQGCQSSDVNVPVIRGNHAPAIRGNDVPPREQMRVVKVQVRGSMLKNSFSSFAPPPAGFCVLL